MYNTYYANKEIVYAIKQCVTNVEQLTNLLFYDYYMTLGCCHMKLTYKIIILCLNMTECSDFYTIKNQSIENKTN